MLEEGAQPDAVIRNVRLLSNNDNIILPPRSIELGEFLTWPKSASRVLQAVETRRFPGGRT